MEKNYYQILGVSETASNEQIKAAFKDKARAFHPDKHAGDPLMEERFKEVNEAYQVLKNPYEKARYDLMRNYQYTYTSSYSNPEPQPRYQQARNYQGSRPSFNYRENWIATAYAFAFSLAMALIIMTGIAIKEEYDQRKREEMLARRKATFEQAIENHKQGDTRQAFILLDSLGGFFKSEQQFEDFRSKLVSEVLLNGQLAFDRDEYEKAIYFFRLIEDFTRVPSLEVKEKLATSYQKTGKYNQSLKTLRNLLAEGYSNLFIYTELASIYENIYQDYSRSLKYYEKARDLTIKYYREVYGEAFPIVLNGRKIPKSHQQLYVDLAESYVLNSEHQNALEITNWIKRVWPDNIETYLIAGKCYEQQGDIKKACTNYRQARLRREGLIIPDICS